MSTPKGSAPRPQTATQPRAPKRPGKQSGLFQKLRAQRRAKANPTGEMTLVEHLQELRHRIVVSLVAVFIGAVIGFIWYQEAPFGMDPLGEILRKPYCSLPPEMRLSFGEDGECRLLATSPFEMLMLRMKIGALAGTVLSSPVWLYQIWAFIVPGLHKKERRVTIIFVASAVSLFVAGAVLAYFILAVGLEFLVGIGSEFQTAALTGEKYFYYLLAMLLIFGVSFEIPLLIITLNIVGILEYRHIKSKRRLIFVVVMIFAAVVTPGQDVFTMIVLACALELLMEASFQFCRINDKRRKRERPDWMDMDDEQASALGEAPGGIQAPTPVSAPSSVQASPSPRTVRPANAEHSAPVAQRDIAKQPPAGGLFDDVL